MHSLRNAVIEEIAAILATLFLYKIFQVWQEKFVIFSPPKSQGNSALFSRLLLQFNYMD